MIICTLLVCVMTVGELLCEINLQASRHTFWRWNFQINHGVFWGLSKQTSFSPICVDYVSSKWFDFVTVSFIYLAVCWFDRVSSSALTLWVEWQEGHPASYPQRFFSGTNVGRKLLRIWLTQVHLEKGHENGWETLCPSKIYIFRPAFAWLLLR